MTSKSKSAAFSDYLKAVGEAARKKKCEEEAAKLATEDKVKNQPGRILSIIRKHSGKN